MIYVIAAEGDEQVVKIGLTTQKRGGTMHEAVLDRMRTLQTAHWRPLLCIAMTSGEYCDEQRLHTEFAMWRMRGEWFRNEGVVAAWVERNRLIEPLRLDMQPRVIDVPNAKRNAAPLLFRKASSRARGHSESADDWSILRSTRNHVIPH